MEADDDFEALLDEALGIQTFQSIKTAADALPEQPPQSLQWMQPVNPWLSPAGSPALSDVSMQLHASPLHTSSTTATSGDDPCLVYSPIREVSDDEEHTPPHTQAPGPAVLPDELPQAVQPQQQQQWDLSAPPVPTSQPLSVAAMPRQGSSRQQAAASLAPLPREVQMRVLCFLSAEALTTLAQTCRHFSALCSEPVLWRRLFVHRWGKNVRQNNSVSWKVGLRQNV